VHVAAQVVGDLPSCPSPGTQICLGRRRQPRRSQDQQEGGVGRRLVQHARCVAHGDAQSVGSIHVDVVVAHGDIGDDAQVTTRPRIQHLRVDAIGEQAHQPVELPHDVDQLRV
jgi:hypothetical protein